MTSIGTSGWSYDHWEPELYPPGLVPGQRLARYAGSFRTVELNSSFYRWPRPAAFASWRQRLPPGFGMSVKAPRGLTHARKLLEPEAWIERIAAGWHELGDKRAVLLVQLGPAQARDDARLDWFLRALPGWIQVAVEFRHPSWADEDVFALLAARGAAYPDDSLAWWADRIREWERQGIEVFVYFNNDGGANAVRNARTLRAVLGQ